MTPDTPIAVVRACLNAYVDKNRAALEALLAEGYHFTSPIDNALDRETYLRVCWPNSAALVRFDEIFELEHGDHAVIVYEAHTSTGKCFRNTEVHTVRRGKLVSTEVYFGWELPHRVPQGAHVENERQRDA